MEVHRAPKNQSLRAPKNSIQKASIRFKTKDDIFTLRATPQSQNKSLSSTNKSTNHVFPHRAETWDQKPIQPTNFLIILKHRGRNMGTREPSLSSSQLLSISSSRWLWVKISNLLCFYVFSILLLSPFS